MAEISFTRTRSGQLIPTNPSETGHGVLVRHLNGAGEVVSQHVASDCDAEHLAGSALGDSSAPGPVLQCGSDCSVSPPYHPPPVYDRVTEQLTLEEPVPAVAPEYLSALCDSASSAVCQACGQVPAACRTTVTETCVCDSDSSPTSPFTDASSPLTVCQRGTVPRTWSTPDDLLTSVESSVECDTCSVHCACSTVQTAERSCSVTSSDDFGTGPLTELARGGLCAQTRPPLCIPVPGGGASESVEMAEQQAEDVDLPDSSRYPDIVFMLHENEKRNDALLDYLDLVSRQHDEIAKALRTLGLKGSKITQSYLLTPMRVAFETQANESLYLARAHHSLADYVQTMLVPVFREMALQYKECSEKLRAEAERNVKRLLAHTRHHPRLRKMLRVARHERDKAARELLRVAGHCHCFTLQHETIEPCVPGECGCDCDVEVSLSEDSCFDSTPCPCEPLEALAQGGCEVPAQLLPPAACFEQSVAHPSCIHETTARLAVHVPLGPTWYDLPPDSSEIIRLRAAQANYESACATMVAYLAPGSAAARFETWFHSFARRCLELEERRITVTRRCLRGYSSALSVIAQGGWTESATNIRLALAQVDDGQLLGEFRQPAAAVHGAKGVGSRVAKRLATPQRLLPPVDEDVRGVVEAFCEDG